MLLGDGLDDDEASKNNMLEKVMKEVNEMDRDKERT